MLEMCLKDTYIQVVTFINHCILVKSCQVKKCINSHCFGYETHLTSLGLIKMSAHVNFIMLPRKQQHIAIFSLNIKQKKG